MTCEWHSFAGFYGREKRVRERIGGFGGVYVFALTDAITGRAFESCRCVHDGGCVRDAVEAEM